MPTIPADVEEGSVAREGWWREGTERIPRESYIEILQAKPTAVNHRTLDSA